MKAKIAVWIILTASCFHVGCNDTVAPAVPESKTALAARSWKGLSFARLTLGDTSRIVTDIVLLFDFKNDGTCTLSQASYSVSSISGSWNFDDNGNSISLTLKRPQATVTEILSIVELTPYRFVIGDTTVYGYSLVPY